MPRSNVRRKADWITWTANDVRKLRMNLDLNLTDFAAELGTTRTTVRNWENGSKQIRGLSSASLTALANRSGYWIPVSPAPGYDVGSTLNRTAPLLLRDR